ncbi:hypothetical protein OG741_01065 [Streptomyces sp. NBC_01410]|uniref:hypothetical protein n=1 Tax=Streptomyces sp. NBC_01410 TaxID=2903856 RepID=UPI00324E0707
MRQYAADHDWPTVIQLPSYAPQLNPVEGIWSLLRRNCTANGSSGTVTSWSRQSDMVCAESSSTPTSSTDARGTRLSPCRPDHPPDNPPEKSVTHASPTVALLHDNPARSDRHRAAARQAAPVLLIDELDKSDIDLPNDLLNVMEESESALPEPEQTADRPGQHEVRTHTDNGRREPARHVRVRCHALPA